MITEQYTNDLLDQIKREGRLGYDKNSDVFKCRKDETYYAVKKLKIEQDGICEGLPRPIVNEINTLVTLRHYKQFISALSIRYTEKNVFIIYDLMDSDLDVYIRRTYSAERIRPSYRLFKIMTEALSILSYHNIAHGDIKSANILVKGNKDDMEFRLADFGLSNLKFSGTPPDDTVYITLWQRAPELLKETYSEFEATPSNPRKHDLKIADVWSTGIVMLEMYTCIFERPNTPEQMLSWICKYSSYKYSETQFIEGIKEGVISHSFNVKHFIKSYTKNSCSLRNGILDLYNTEHLEVVAEMLEVNPIDRWIPSRLRLQEESTAGADPSPSSIVRDEMVMVTIIDLCQLAALPLSVALTALDIHSRFTDKCTVPPPIAEIYILVAVRLANALFIYDWLGLEDLIHYYAMICCITEELSLRDICERMNESISLAPENWDENIEEQVTLHENKKEELLSLYTAETIVEAERELLAKLNYKIFPHYMIHLLSSAKLFGYTYENLSCPKITELFI